MNQIDRKRHMMSIRKLDTLCAAKTSELATLQHLAKQVLNEVARVNSEVLELEKELAKLGTPMRCIFAERDEEGEDQ